VTEHNSIEEDQKDYQNEGGIKIKPIRTGGGFLLPSMHPEAYAEQDNQNEGGMKFKPIRTGGGFLLPSTNPEAYAEQLKQ
jgi:hypothetical protein